MSFFVPLFDAGDPPVGMPGEDGDHAPVQRDGDENAAAQPLEDAPGTLRCGPELTESSVKDLLTPLCAHDLESIEQYY